MKPEQIESLIESAIQEAAELGKETGTSAAEWFAQDAWGGRATRGEKEAAQRFLDACEEGGDTPDAPNLSGEWADSETPRSLMDALFDEDELDLEEVQNAQDEICQAWEDACNEAFYATLQASAQSVLE